MRVRSGILATLSVALVAVGGAVGYAQAQPSGQPRAPGQPGQPGQPVATSGMQLPVNLSQEEMNKQSEESLQHIFSNGKIVRKMHSDAREKKDVVKALCLDDKVNQLDVTYRSASERRGALSDATKRRDNELASHEFTILAELKKQADRTLGEANQCIGTDVDYTAESSVTPAIEPGIPDVNDTTPNVPLFPIIIPPPSCVSCAL